MPRPKALRDVAPVLACVILAACGGSSPDGDPSTSEPGVGADAGRSPDGAATAVDAQAGASADAANDALRDATNDAAKDAANDAPSDAPSDAMTATAARSAIDSLAVGSACYKYSWKDRGQMPRGYIRGFALVFARAACDPSRSDLTVVAKANTHDDAHDALSWYDAIFSGLSMSNAAAGTDTLRHTYALLLGLGMRESSGEHCCGRDMSATNVSSDSAEAGAWQTSWDSHGASPELTKMFDRYRTNPPACFLDEFKDGVTCSATNWQDWGTGADGLAFQKMEKECPAFAAEYAAVMLRVSGGSSGHYGPLRTRAAEVRPECDALLSQVQALVAKNPAVCGAL